MKAEKGICSKVKAAWRDAVQTKKIVRELIMQSSDQLRNGVWKIRWGNSKAFLVRNSADALDFYRSYCRRSNTHIKNWIRDGLMNLLCIDWKYRFYKSAFPKFTADCIIISVSGTPIFFDLKKMILIKRNEKGNQGYYRLKEAGYWEHFKTPVFKIKDGVSYEKVILSHKQSTGKENQEKMFQNILRKYVEYFDAARPAECRTVRELVIPFQASIPEFDRIFSPSILDLSINCYMQHGDLKPANLIWDHSGSVYAIDYETAAILPFFQDILYYAAYRVVIEDENWDLLNSLMDTSTKIGHLFDDILTRQGIPKDRAVKIAFTILSRAIMPSIVNGVFSVQKENDLKNFCDLRDQRTMKKIIAHFMNEEMKFAN